MPHKIIFISHPIRTASWKRDIQDLQRLLALLKQQCRTQEVAEYPMAPYLLHAQVLGTYAQLKAYRLSYAHRQHDYSVVHHDELHVYGDNIIDEMVAEALAASEQGIPVFIKSEMIQCNPLSQVFIHSCSA